MRSNQAVHWLYDCLFSHKLTFWLKGVESLDPKYSSSLLISPYMHRLSVIRLLFHLCHQRSERERERKREREGDREREISRGPSTINQLFPMSGTAMRPPATSIGCLTVLCQQQLVCEASCCEVFSCADGKRHGRSSRTFSLE